MSTFTPLSSFAGGILIGIAASILLLCNGRVAGVSGIVGGLVAPRPRDVAWRASFVGGLVSGGVVLRVVRPAAVSVGLGGSLAMVLVAGLLVGVGTRLGSGCTSGHGVCGISRGSVRSIVATLVFMTAGAVTVFVARHLLGGAP
jgi:uncharacterized membrane protein YedE/YeeE